MKTTAAEQTPPPSSPIGQAIASINPRVRHNRKVSWDLQQFAENIHRGKSFLDNEQARKEIEDSCNSVSKRREKLDNYSLLKQWTMQGEICKKLCDCYDELAKAGDQLVDMLYPMYLELKKDPRLGRDEERLNAIDDVIKHIQRHDKPGKKRQPASSRTSSTSTQEPIQQQRPQPDSPPWLGTVNHINPQPFSQSQLFSVYEGDSKDENGRGLAVVVKRQIFNGATNERQLERLVREINAWSTLKHENIVECYGWQYYTANQEDKIQIITPYFRNRDVMNYLLGNPNVDARFRIICGAARALNYLHTKQSKVYGTFRPAVLLISDDGHGLLTNFYTTKDITPDKALYEYTYENSLGTARYASPEASSEAADGTMEFRSDVWSWAMVSLEIMTGMKPFRGLNTSSAVIGKLAKREDPVLDLFTYQGTAAGMATRKRYPKFWALLERCWKWRPNDRPTMAQVLKHLKKMEREAAKTPL